VGFEPTIPVFEQAKMVHALAARPLWSIIISNSAENRYDMAPLSSVETPCFQQTKFAAQKYMKRTGVFSKIYCRQILESFRATVILNKTEDFQPWDARVLQLDSILCSLSLSLASLSHINFADHRTAQCSANRFRISDVLASNLGPEIGITIKLLFYWAHPWKYWDTKLEHE
jgi:hypothetical protein